MFATSLNWNGSGVSGSDPLGHTWLYNSTSSDVGAWGIPGYQQGSLAFQGDFVKDFHITFNLANFPDQQIDETLTDTITGLSSSFRETEVVFWNKYFWDSDGDQRLDSASFWSPSGAQLNNLEDFWTNIIFTQAWPTINFGATSVLVTPDFTASWTEDGTPVPESATMLLLGTGLVGVAGAARRKKNNQV